MRQQHGCRFRADAWHAGNVVDCVPAKRTVIGDLVRMHAVPFLDARGVPALGLLWGEFLPQSSGAGPPRGASSGSLALALLLLARAS